MMAKQGMLVVILIILAAIATCVALPIEKMLLAMDYQNGTLPRCELILVSKTIEPSLFKDPKYGLLKHYVKIYTVRTSNASAGNFCELPVDSLSAELYSPQMAYTHFTCSGSSPWFTNPNSIQRSHLAILHLRNCHASWMNLAIFGESVDMKNLILDRCSVIEDSIETPQLYNQTDDLVPVPGLDKVVALTIISRESGRMTTPDILLTRKWPEMAEIELKGMKTTQAQINGLKRSMPNLQTLELYNSAESYFPSDFPWDPMRKALPQNLSRSSFFDDHYSGSIGLILEPHYFRRSLVLEGNGLTDLAHVRLKGKLDRISLAMNQISKLGNETFSGVEGLHNLKLNNNKLAELSPGLFANLTSLRWLDLSRNYITNLSNGVFAGLSNLEVLELTNNLLTICSPGVFASLFKLVLLDLSSNNIRSFGNDAFGSEMPSEFREINLNQNKMAHFPGWIFTTRSLKNIKLSRNPLSFDIFERDLDEMNPNAITFRNRESASSLSSPFKPLYHKIVDLSYNNFTSLKVDNFSQTKMTTFRTILNFFHLDLHGNGIICDCHTYGMYRFLNERRVEMEVATYNKLRIPSYYYQAWKCSIPVDTQHIPMVDISNRTFMCQDTMNGCPERCICLKRSVDGSVMVNCSAQNLTHLPESVPNGTDTVLFTHNTMSSVSDTKYLRSLNHLDVSHNKITEVTDEAIRSFHDIASVDLRNNRISRFPVQFKHLQTVDLMLSGNRFVCDCHEKWAVRWLFDYRRHIPDIGNIRCSSGVSHSEIIYQANIDEFICEVTKETIIAIATTISVIMLLVIVVLVLGYTFRGEIKVILYFHFKWHPFDRTDKTDVVDKLYDAFVSYNQADVDYVLNTLKPAMETGRNPYRLCIHERDFKPGGGITQNVLYSVKYSRRMIMILTKNFLKSEWCRLEFKSAHRRVLKDRSNYLIVILFDGLDVNDLDEEIKLYLKTNTYIRHDSEWFWQRLFYALPQKPLSLLRQEAFPKGGYETLFPTPTSVAIMQTVQNIRTLAQDPDAQVTPVMWDSDTFEAEDSFNSLSALTQMDGLM